jgi:FtsH-binding integral membrane protein
MSYNPYSNQNPYQKQGGFDNPVAGSFSTDVSRKYLLNVYNWMAFGLALTALVALFVSRSDVVLEAFILNRPVFYGLLIAQFVVVLGLTFAINKIPTIVAIGAFFFYAALTGITMSILFLIYTSASIATTFFVCAGMFASVSAFGYLTKRDLSGMGTFLYMGLIGLIIASVVNIFLGSSMIYWITTYAGVLIFTGLTAYDTQKIKRLSSEVDFNTDIGKKSAVISALMLYLDFINMFIYLLRIFGSRK